MEAMSETAPVYVGETTSIPAISDGLQLDNACRAETAETAPQQPQRASQTGSNHIGSIPPMTMAFITERCALRGTRNFFFTVVSDNMAATMPPEAPLTEIMVLRAPHNLAALRSRSNRTPAGSDSSSSPGSSVKSACHMLDICPKSRPLCPGVWNDAFSKRI